MHKHFKRLKTSGDTYPPSPRSVKTIRVFRLRLDWSETTSRMDQPQTDFGVVWKLRRVC